MNCPICGGAPEVVSQGAYGYIAHCAECYEGDPEAESWRWLQGFGDTPEEATERWLERARDEANSETHHLEPSPYTLNYLFRDLSVQVLDESERQSEWVWLHKLGPNLDVVTVEWGPRC